MSGSLRSLAENLETNSIIFKELNKRTHNEQDAISKENSRKNKCK